MMYGPEGINGGRKLISACEALVILEQRDAESYPDFPHLSDLLGSDWGKATDSRHEYMRQAYDKANRIYGIYQVLLGGNKYK